MTSQEKVIEKIRREIWQVDREDEGVKTLKAQFQNAMVQLSEKLYSSNGHFIFELLQNADDNSYTKNQVPTLLFYLREEGLTLVNNEDGFVEENVFSICQIGKSTKKAKIGFIGEKGIGFKSCFRITNEPHIFSNNFNFKFDKRQELGYVIPILLKDTKDIPLKIEEDKTFIHLPFQKGISYEEIQELLKDINLETLLFLRRLKIIEIQLPEENSIKYQVIQKNSIDYTLKNNEKDNYFKVIKKEFDTSSVKSTEDDRSNVDKVEIILAFKIDEENNPILYESNLFAFLPVKNVGFKFCIQSDFITISSRENIDKEKKWNRFIRDQIADVVIEASKYFKEEKNLKLKWWNYLPLRKEVDLFFKSSVDDIYKKLKKENSILTMDDHYLKPYEIIDYNNDLIELFSNQELFKHLSFEYINPKLELTKDLKEILEIKNFTSEMLHKIILKLDLKLKPDHWFTKLYQYIQKNEISMSKDLKFIRLENGEISNIEKLYFPYGIFEKETEIDSEIQRNIKVMKKGTLYEDNILDNLIYKYFEKEGVKQITFQDIIQNEIFSDSSKMKEETHLYHTFFLRENFHEMNEEMIDYLKNNFTFITKGKERKVAKEIYLSKEYSKEHEPQLESFLIRKSFLSPKYIDYTIKTLKKDKDLEFEKWRKFFESLELNGYLKLYESTYKLSEVECKAYKYFNSSATVTDVNLTDEIKSIIKSNPKEVIKMIDFYWKYYQEFKDKTITPTKKFLHSITRPSSFFEFIQNVQISTQSGIWEIKELFYGNRSMDFIDWPYYSEEIKNQELRKYLNITENFTDIETFLKRIRQLKKDKTLINSSIYLQNFNILNHLKNIEESKNLKEIFTKEELIFIKDKWYLSNQLFWEQDDVFDSSIVPPLSNLFTGGDKEENKKFFLNIGVQRERNYKDLISVLDQFSKHTITEETKKNILKIYFKLDSLIESGYDISWFKESKEKVILTSKGLIGFDSTVYLNDNDDLYLLFNDKVPIVSFPKLDIGKLHNLTRFLSLKSLNSSVKSSMSQSHFEIDIKQSETLKRNFQYIEKYFINYDYYFYLENKHLFPSDKIKIEYRVVNNEIHLNYELEKNFISHSSKVKWDSKNHFLYVQKNKTTKNDILNEISGIYPTLKKNELKSFLFTLFTSNNPEEYFNFLGISEKIEIKNLNSDEDKTDLETNEGKMCIELFGDVMKYENVFPTKIEDEIIQPEIKQVKPKFEIEKIGISFESQPYKPPMDVNDITIQIQKREISKRYNSELKIEWIDFTNSNIKNPFKNLDKDLKTHQNEEISKEIDLEGMKIVLNYELNRIKNLYKNIEILNNRDPMIQKNAFIIDVSTKDNIEFALKYSPDFKSIYNQLIKNKIQPFSLGFDILTIHPFTKLIDRVIEVKSSSIMKSAVEFTNLEWDSYHNPLLKQKYYLYFVGNIYSIPKGYIFNNIDSLKNTIIPRYILDLGLYKEEIKIEKIEPKKEKEIKIEPKKEDFKIEKKIEQKIEPKKEKEIKKEPKKEPKKKEIKIEKIEPKKEEMVILETINERLIGVIEEYSDQILEGKILDTSRSGSKKYIFELSECEGFFPKKGLEVSFNLIQSQCKNIKKFEKESSLDSLKKIPKKQNFKK